MDPGRWEQVRSVFDEVVQLAPSDRASRLAIIATTDPVLHDALVALLDGDAQVDDLLAPLESRLFPTPVSERSESFDLRARVQAALGDTYRLERELDGGMSAVFVATETEFQRKVVVKILRPELAGALSAKRFQREITFAATLQHPRIVPLLRAGEADGFLFYTMPFVVGESLRDRLRREGELPIDDTIRILRDVASALAYAHTHGVVHRDIKPENVLLSEDGAVVADFGIAKVLSASLVDIHDGNGSAKKTTTMTERGMVLGTPLYMSPEQGAGETNIDHRADLYALGVMSYEMLTGRPPFERSSTQQLMAAHATEVPELVTKRRPNTPSTLASIVMRCLEKHPADRPRDARELVRELGRVEEPDSHKSGKTSERAALGSSSIDRPRSLFGWLGGLAAAAMAFGAVFLIARGSQSGDREPLFVDVSLPDSASPHSAGGSSSIALSPDGTVMAYVGGTLGTIFVKRLDETRAPWQVPESERAMCPSFSPDGQWIVFGTAQSLRKVSARGPSQPIIINASRAWCPVWTDRNEIVFDDKGSLFRVSAEGGMPSLVAGNTNGNEALMPSQALPGGRDVIVSYVERTHPQAEQLGIVSLEDGRLTPLHKEGSAGWFSNGYILFYRSGLSTAPFSLRRRSFLGPETQILGDTTAAFGVSETGAVIYMAAGEGIAATLRPMRVDERGLTHQLPGGVLQQGTVKSAALTPLDTISWAWPHVSPDGKRIAIEVETEARRWDVWVYDIFSRTLTRVTSDYSGVRPFGWTPDGREVLFLATDSADFSATHRIMAQRWDGGAPAHELMRFRMPLRSVSMGPPHTYLALEVFSPSDIWVAPIDTPAAARPFAATAAFEAEPRVSGDGKLLAYTSDQTGRREVYVQPIIGRATRLQVSEGGGSQPVWSRDGTHLYYRGPHHMMRSALDTRELRVLRRDTLFRDVYEPHDRTNYDVFPDGTGLLMARGTAPRFHVSMLMNWPEYLRKRVANH